MQVKEYLDTLLNAITANPFTVSQSISFEERPPDSAFIIGLITFTDGSRLYLKEFVFFESKGVKVIKYGYNYLANDETLIFRYDNALDPQAKNFPTYPEHKHTVKEIAPAKRPVFKDVLSEISGIIEAIK